jgi:hypothetical protein
MLATDKGPTAEVRARCHRAIPTIARTHLSCHDPSKFGVQLTEMHAWLDANCGADGWAMTPAGLRGVVNDAVAIYFLDPTLAAAFVSRWCAGAKTEIAEGAFQVREDQPSLRVQAGPHKTF